MFSLLTVIERVYDDGQLENKKLRIQDKVTWKSRVK